MVRIPAGIFVILHGLVHLWYVVLSYKLVEFQPEMGWTGKSWLLSSIMEDSAIRSSAGILFTITVLLFLISSIGVFSNANWLNTALVISAGFSSLLLIIFWDGSLSMIVQKGLIVLLINLVLIAVAII